MSTNRNGDTKEGPKVLRIGIVQRGKIIEEREIKKRETVSIGSSSRCTFQVTSENLPKSFDLFEFDGKSYFLRFDTGIEGRIQLEDEQVADFRALDARGLVVQRGGRKAVQLTDKSRGKVMVGDVTVLFQFKTMTPAPVRPVLPADVRGSFLQNIDTQFAAIFVVVALLQISVLTYARSLPYVEPTSIEEVSEIYQKIIMPDRIPEPPRSAVEESAQDANGSESKKPAPKKKAPKKKEKKKSSGDKEASAKTRQAANREKVAGRGLLQVLGAKRGGDGAIADVFGTGGPTGSLGEAFDGIQGIEVANEAGQTGTRGGGSGESVEVGSLGTRGGGRVSTGKKRAVAVRGRLDTQAPVVDGSLDRKAVNRVMRRKKSGIKACYENALKRDRSLGGKLIISFEIDERGRIQSLAFSGSLRSRDVEQCIKRISRSWRFPRPDGGSVFVDYPIVFTPSS